MTILHTADAYERELTYPEDASVLAAMACRIVACAKGLRSDLDALANQDVNRLDMSYLAQVMAEAFGDTITLEEWRFLAARVKVEAGR